MRPAKAAPARTSGGARRIIESSKSRSTAVHTPIARPFASQRHQGRCSGWSCRVQGCMPKVFGRTWSEPNVFFASTTPGADGACHPWLTWIPAFSHWLPSGHASDAPRHTPMTPRLGGRSLDDEVLAYEMPPFWRRAAQIGRDPASNQKWHSQSAAFFRFLVFGGGMARTLPIQSRQCPLAQRPDEVRRGGCLF